jgi:hypothetical protein
VSTGDDRSARAGACRDRKWPQRKRFSMCVRRFHLLIGELRVARELARRSQ